MKLKTRLSLSFILLVVVLMSGLFLSVFFGTRQIIERNSLQHLRSVAARIETGIQQITKHERTLFDLVASRTQLRELLHDFNQEDTVSRARMLEILSDALTAAHDTQGFILYDKDLNLVVSTDQEKVVDFAMPGGLLERASESVTGMILPTESGEPVMLTAGPLLLEGEFAGVLMMVSSVELFLNIVTDNAGLGETGDAFLVMQDGREGLRVVTPRRFAAEDFIGKRIAVMSDELRMALDLKSGQAKMSAGLVDYRGYKVISVAKYLEKQNWVLILKMDQHEAFAPLRTMHRNILTVFLAVGGVCAAVIWLAGGLIVRPISRLSKVCTGFISGNSDVRVEDSLQKGTHETAILARAMNLMLDQIRRNTENQARRQAELLVLKEHADLARQEAELARDATARFAAIVDSSTDAIISKSLDGIITSWNRAAEMTYGYRAAEVIGKPITILIPEERTEELAFFLRSIKEGKAINNFETFRKRKDGTLLDVSLSISPVLDSGGRIIGASTIARDITERKRARERFRLVVEAAPNAMIMVDREGSIILVNRQAEVLFGYSREEMRGRKIEMLVPQRFQAHHPAHRQDFFREPKARAMGAGRDLFGLKKDGREVPIEIGLTPIDTPEGLCTLASIIDITERKKSDAIIRNKTQELETMLHIISHDLGEPLRAIQSFSEIILDEYADKFDDKGSDLLSRIDRAAIRMKKLLAGILQLSKIRKMEETYENVRGTDIVAEALQPVKETIDEKKARVSIAEKFPVYTVNKLWATQALTNLISNALKYHEEDKAPEIEICPYESGGDSSVIGFVVKDRGPGISPAYAERIFQLFQRAVGRDVEGVGAGLAIVAEVAKKHGGSAWAEPRPGGGSEFILSFNMRETRHSVHASAAASGVSGR